MDAFEWIVQVFALPAFEQKSLYPDYMVGTLQLGYAWKVFIKEHFSVIHTLPQAERDAINTLTNCISFLDKERYYKCWKKNGFAQKEWDKLRDCAKKIMAIMKWEQKVPQGFVHAKNLKQGRTFLINLPIPLILGANYALQGSVYSELRAVALRYRQKELLIRFYLDRAVIKRDDEAIALFEKKLKNKIGDFYSSVNLECIEDNTPLTSMDYFSSKYTFDTLDGLIYCRCEYSENEWGE